MQIYLRHLFHVRNISRDDISFASQHIITEQVNTDVQVEVTDIDSLSYNFPFHEIKEKCVGYNL